MNSLDMRGSGAAAAADDVDKAALREFLQETGSIFRSFRKARWRKRIGKASIGIGADICVGYIRQFFDIRAHQFCAESAVKPDGKRLRVAHRVPERLGGLTGKRAPRLVGDCA